MAQFPRKREVISSKEVACEEAQRHGDCRLDDMVSGSKARILWCCGVSLMMAL